jgi:hypothetical protein
LFWVFIFKLIILQYRAGSDCVGGVTDCVGGVMTVLVEYLTVLMECDCVGGVKVRKLNNWRHFFQGFMVSMVNI